VIKDKVAIAKKEVDNLTAELDICRRKLQIEEDNCTILEMRLASAIDAVHYWQGVKKKG